MDKRDLKNITAMTETAGRKLIESYLDNLIGEYTDIITGDNLETWIEADLNKLKYNDYDVMRIVRKELKAIRDRPAYIMEMSTDVEEPRDYSEEL